MEDNRPPAEQEFSRWGFYAINQRLRTVCGKPYIFGLVFACLMSLTGLIIVWTVVLTDSTQTTIQNSSFRNTQKGKLNSTNMAITKPNFGDEASSTPNEDLPAGVANHLTAEGGTLKSTIQSFSTPEFSSEAFNQESSTNRAKEKASRKMLPFSPEEFWIEVLNKTDELIRKESTHYPADPRIEDSTPRPSESNSTLPQFSIKDGPF